MPNDAKGHYRLSDGKKYKGYKVYDDGSIVCDNEAGDEMEDIIAALNANEDVMRQAMKIATDRQQELNRKVQLWWVERGKDLNIDVVNAKRSYESKTRTILPVKQ